MLEQILAALGLITAIGAATGYLVKLWKWAKTPNDKQDDRLDDMEKRLDKHDVLLDNDKKKLDKIETGSRVQLRALLAITNHMIDNNHTEQLKKVQDELQEYLINVN